MRDVQGGDPDHDLDPPDLLAELAADLGVERGQRLVEEQHARLDREGAGERDALLLAARHLVRIAAGLGSEPDQVEHLVGLLLAGGAVHAAEAEAVGHVVPSRHVREQAVRLEDDPHVPPIGGDTGDVPTVHEDPSLVDLVEATKGTESRRLATPRRAQEGNELAGGDVDRQPVQGVDRAVPAVHVLERDPDAVAVGRDGWTRDGHVAGSSTSRWSRRPPPPTRAMTIRRMNANTSADSDTATEMNGSRPPSR